MSFTLYAHAKVNLTLEVLGKRDDGYHEIRSILQAVSLADTLTFSPCDSIEFRCNIHRLESHDNLVVKAYHLLKESAGFAGGASIHLHKRIPSSAGLGSGSTGFRVGITSVSPLCPPGPARWIFGGPAGTTGAGLGAVFLAGAAVPCSSAAH